MNKPSVSPSSLQSSIASSIMCRLYLVRKDVSRGNALREHKRRVVRHREHALRQILGAEVVLVQIHIQAQRQVVLPILLPDLPGVQTSRFILPLNVSLLDCIGGGVARLANTLPYWQKLHQMLVDCPLGEEFQQSKGASMEMQLSWQTL